MSGARLYRVSALASGGVRMWRGWRVIVPVIVVNALIQAALVWPPFSYGTSWWLAIAAVLSAATFAVAYGLVGVTALAVPDGSVDWPTAVERLRPHLVPYLLWALGLLVVVAIGFALFTLPGLVVLALTPFVLLAALDGRPNALGWNLRVIGRRFWRWLLTVLVVGVLLVVADLVAGLFTFFTRLPLAALVVWLVGGVVVAWWTTAFALIYRSARQPDLEPGESTPILGGNATRGGAAR